MLQCSLTDDLDPGETVRGVVGFTVLSGEASDELIVFGGDIEDSCVGANCIDRNDEDKDGEDEEDEEKIAC